jgi:hypothetical protein
MRGPGFLLLAVFMLAGCETFTFQQYSLSQRNIQIIRETMVSGGVSSIAVGEFTAASPGHFEIECGMNGQIRTPQDIPFEKYIREAFIDELKKADAYWLDQIEAGRVITGYLDNVKINSTTGSWDFKLIIKFKSGESFTVFESYPLDDVSCEQSAAAFVPAVQELIYKIITHPVFREKMGLTTH